MTPKRPLSTRAIPHPNPAVILAVMMGLFTAWTPGTARAAPQPVTVQGNTATAQGNQTNGILSGRDFNSPPVQILDVNTLSGAIRPPSGSTGIGFTNTRGGNITINAGDASTNILITTSGNQAVGIGAESRGTPPPAPIDPFLDVPIPGNPDVAGGVVQINSYSDITTAGSSAPGILAQSRTTGYGSDVLDALQNFSETNFSFAVIGVTHADGSAGIVGQAVQGTLIGTNGSSVPGDGGLFTLNPNGTFAFDPGTNFNLAVGETRVSSVNYVLAGSRSGMLLRTDIAGQLFVTVSNNGSGLEIIGSEAYFSEYGESAKPQTENVVFPDLQHYVQGLIRTAEDAGGSGNSVEVAHHSGAISTTGASSHGIFAESAGKSGSRGRDGGGFFSFGNRPPTAGGSGNDGGLVSVTVNGAISTSFDGTANNASLGVFAFSQGGNGGRGGDGGFYYDGRRGGNGGDGGTVMVSGNGTIQTVGKFASGIYALSEGGNGGRGGDGDVFTSGQRGGYGGHGGNVFLEGLWNITTRGDYAHGIWAKSVGGNAGDGGSGGWISGSPGGGGRATDGGAVSVISGGRIETFGADAFGIYAQSVGGFGGSGGSGGSIFVSSGGDGNSAGSGGAVQITQGTNATVTTHGDRSHAIYAQSVGGGGGSAGSSGGVVSLGGSGSSGGNGRTVAVTNRGQLVTMGEQAIGIFAQSVGGGGGSSGASGGAVSLGGSSGGGGAGGEVSVVNENTGSMQSGAIATMGDNAHAILAQSIGGGGGNAGNSGGTVSLGGSGSDGGNAGTVNVFNSATLVTTGDFSRAIFAQSIGGGGGAGGNSSGTVSLGGSGGSAGHGGIVNVANENNGFLLSGVLSTAGTNSHAIFAQSVGGGGGSAGNSDGAVSLGGSGSSGGNAGAVTVNNDGSLHTTGAGARGIFAQSVGGGGGDGGLSVGAVSFGGANNSGGNGAAVVVSNLNSGLPGNGAISTEGTKAHAIFAQSVGGGGGSGGGSGGLVSFGASGGAGGNASTVTVHNTGALRTHGSDASGIFAQSVGGGGGDGGNSVSVSAFVGFAMGGSGAIGGASEHVNVFSGDTTIVTAGERSHGIFAQGVGGGGGNGGWAVGVAGGVGVSLNATVGGRGGGGGDGSVVSVTSASSIATAGQDAHGIMAQSVGGGGGNGGFSIALGGSDGVAISAGFGGTGGDGGVGKAVNVTSTGTLIETLGHGSSGLFAQSVGGGGGNGGFSIAGAGGGIGAGGISFGGKGGGGGDSAAVLVLNSSSMTTRGDDAFGIFAQSVGGGGGNGRFSIAGAGAGTGSGAISIGGSGGLGGNASSVSVTNTGALIETFGNGSIAVLAQSVGGGGGNGGFSIAGAGAGTGSGAISVGGSGGGGGNGDMVRLLSGSVIRTHGEDAHGLFAQSLGGGGGNGRFSISGSGAGTGSGTFNVGGFGGTGGVANAVSIISTGMLIETWGNAAIGLFAQSLGGGGGNGGFSISGSGAGTGSGTFSLGGGGGAGGNAGSVHVENSSMIVTHGTNDAHAIFAQSLGGGGGNGRFSISGSGAGTGSGTLNIGGAAGGGGESKDVSVTNTGAWLETFGDSSSGIFAQSVGGGGGNGGFSLTGSGAKSGAGSVGVGGFGGDGGEGGAVQVSSTSRILARGADSHGILAQSLGGGGGNGRFSIVGSGASTGSGTLGVGGAGGAGGDGKAVTVTNTGEWIETFGESSSGIFAQSVGGGGGNGGFSISGSGAKSGAGSLSVGGFGGLGGDAGLVQVFSSSSILTRGSNSHGILAQSVGGGGGNGRFSIAASGAISNSMSASLGGFGGTGGFGSQVIVISSGPLIEARGPNAHGILAQSIGGGGGNGGFSGAGSLVFGGTNAKVLAVSVGGSAGGGNDANKVSVMNNATILSSGEDGGAIMAQSLGGGGGNGGGTFTGSLSGGGARELAVAVGGLGGSGGHAGEVNVTNAGAIVTLSNRSEAILAQSIGGGGGRGGFAARADINILGGGTNASTLELGVTVGGAGGAGGNGGAVSVLTTNVLMTFGAASHGVMAQSVGGGGGSGGASTSFQAFLGGSSASSNSLNVDIGVGGFGRAAGSGSNVLVISQGRIETAGAGAHGIFAQSVGGGGGNGGDVELKRLQFSGSNPGDTNVTEAGFAVSSAVGTNSVSTNQSRSLSLSASVGIGGRGGSAGDGGAVTVHNEADILTRSNGSRGIFAQSVGGGGGTGGASTTESGDGNANRTIGIGVSLGGNGARGGVAGAVSVTSLKTIVTLGDDAHGIMAQSVGGGGGAGGASTSISEKSKAGEDTTLAVTGQVSIGGEGGVAGDGGTVTVTNRGLIDTSGRKAYGILAQSVGGGGGFGGTTKVEHKQEKETNATSASASPFVLLSAMSASASTNGSSGTNMPSAERTNSWNLNVAIGAGGLGGSAGDGGAVTVENEGDIVTRGRESMGIFAQSVGGGGGAGGSSSTENGEGNADRVIGIGVSLGGQGGAGGTGDVVRVSSRGTIVTLGDDAHGIMAQSIGGGGGAGGADNSTFETVAVATNTMRAATVTVGLGGDGGVAGNGGIVTVTNQGLIDTSGRKAYGILAQSIGGGGGFGGATKVERKQEMTTNAPESVLFSALQVAASTNGTAPGTNMPSAGRTNSWNLTVAIGAGGNGGSAGQGGAVTVDNDGDIVTRGQEAVGIFAQSVGGGGGAGGASTTDNAGGSGDRVIALGVSLGGQGTNGGWGDYVTVNNRGTIVTLGDDAHGIMAQSVGGGGGAGGANTTVSDAIETQTNTMRSASVTVGLGGDGGVAGNGGSVSVTNRGLIDTSGRKSYGILAQSIGGGGGFGGLTEVEQNQEKEMEATNASRFVRFTAMGGGGGSTNGMSGTNMPSAGRTNSWNLNVTIGGGGRGGSAGDGGAVTVANEGNIVTRAQESVGIFAQSVGGGGGVGGSTATENGGGNADRVLGIGVSLGGAGGPGGSGGSVLVTNRGSISTLGDDAHGIMAQSVGGGGGAGGARLFSADESGATNTRALTVNIGVGGSGGLGGSGSNVVVINDGSIVTAGRGAYGIFAQSIGGGGGVAGSATHSTGSNTFLQTLFDVQIAVGGSGTNSGDGGEVHVRQTGTVTTSGEGAFGVFAQSVGGGGGIGGQSVLGLTGKIGLGGAGGAGGNASDVIVDLTGDITTYGNGTYGIFAQSVGGGGGLAGNVDRGLATFGPFGTATNLGVGLAVGRDGGAGGDGGAVTVNSSGRIVTFGEGSIGIFAQSVGGGGGLAGSLGTNLPALAFQNSAGSAGAAGSGGEVNVNHTGNITTLGDNSHGIFIQSAGGEDDGGKINLQLIGSIHVMGANSDAVFVQSVGGRTNQDITITLREGAVQGGVGSGAAVRLSDGASNTLNNFNTLFTMSQEANIAGNAQAVLSGFGASTTRGGNVIVGGNGDDTINNRGIISGSVDLGTGRNAFNNFRHFNPGAIISLGAGNRLMNGGILSPGGQEMIQATMLAGDLDQTSSGALRMKLASASRYDVLTINGTAALDGKLSVFRFNAFVPREGDEFAILTADQGITGEFATVEDPLKGNYALQLQTIYSADSVVLQTEQDSFLQFARTPNQRSVSRNLDSFSGLDSGFEDARGAGLIEFLNTVPGPMLPNAYDQIAPEELGAAFDLGMGAADASALNMQRRLGEIRAGSTGFSESLSLARPSEWQLTAHAFYGVADAGQEPLPSVMNPSPDNRWGFFATGSGEFTDVDGTANSAGYDFTSAGITVGADYRVNRQFAVGIMAGYLDVGADLIDDGDVDDQGIKGGVYATWYDKGFYVDSALGGGYHFYDTRRGVFDATARGSTEGTEFDGFIGAGYNVKRGRLTVGPTLTVQYTYLGIDSFTETGSGAPLAVEDNDSHSLRTRLGGRLAYDLETASVTLRPEIRLAWHHEFLDRDRAIDSRLASGAGTIFQVNSPEIGRDSLALSLGLTAEWSSRLSTSLFYDTQLARENYIVHTVSAGLRWSF